MYNKRLRNRSFKTTGPLQKMIDNAVEERVSALKNVDEATTTRTSRGVGSDKVKGVRTLTEIIKSTATSTKPGETTRGKGPGYEDAWDNLSEEEKAKFGSIDNFKKEAEAWHDKNTTPDETVETEIETEKKTQKANLQMPRKVDISTATGVRGDFNVIDPETKDLIPYSSLMQTAQKNEDGLLVNESGQPYYGQPIAKFAPELKGSESSGFTLGKGKQFNPNSNSAYMGEFKNRKAMIQGMGYTEPSLNQAIQVPVGMTDDNEVQYSNMTVSQFANANPDSMSMYGIGDQKGTLQAVNLQQDYSKMQDADQTQGKVGGAGGESNKMMDLGPDGNFVGQDFGQFGSYKGGGDNSIQRFQLPERKTSEAPDPAATNMKRPVTKMLQGRTMSFRKNKF